MSTAKYQITNFTVDDPATLKAKLDGNSAVLARTGGAFQCHAADAPNMTVKVAAGGQLVAGALVENALQTSGAIVAPVANPRIDRVVIDQSTGVASIVAGAEAAIPAAPAIPEGKWPCARFQLATATVAITNNMIVDERPFVQKPSASTAYGAVWQSIRSAALDSSGYNALLSAGAGLNFNVDASPTAAILDFGNGSTISTATLSADAANQGALVASNTNFIYADYASATSVTWGNCLIPPQIGYAFDRTQGALLNFEGADASTTMLDNFGNTWTAAGNAQIDTAQFKFGTSSLLLDGTGDYVKSTDFTSLGDGSWEMSVWFRIAALPGADSFVELMQFVNAGTVGARIELLNAAGTTRLRLRLSSDGTSHNLRDADGANTAWALNQWNRVRVQFDALGGQCRVFLSLNGAAETTDQSFAVTARICAVTSATLGAEASGSSAFNGHIDAFRFIRAATVTAAETPAADAPTIADHKVHFLSIPQRTMYEVTAASSAAGSNPTLTARTRLFVGEQDTNATVVTATRNYAIRGEYLGALTTPLPGASVSTTVNHKLGTAQAVNAAVEFVCLTTDNAAIPGDVITSPSVVSFDGTYFRPIVVHMKRNSATFTTSSSQPYQALLSSGAQQLALASWGYRVRVQRGW